MNKADNLAVAMRAKANAMLSLGAISLNGKALIACDNQFHRAIEFFGGVSNEARTRRQLRLGAEGPADKGAHDPDMLSRDAELLRNAVFQSEHDLAWLGPRELLAVSALTGS